MDHKISQKIIVAIIIPVFNGLEYTMLCLKTLSELILDTNFYTYDFKIVIVDDGSTDGTANWIKKEFPSVHLKFGNGSLWWSGGINKGVSYALNQMKAEYILWWNNDIQPTETYFEELVKILDKQGSDVIVGSKIFILNSNLIWGMGGKFDPNSGLRHMYGEQQNDSEFYNRSLEVDWFPGMGTTIHKKVFDQIGLLDEKNFPQYHGDSDFTFRAKQAGFKLIAFPQLVLYNDNSNTGLKHNNKFSGLFKTLTNTKSNYNLMKDIAFYKKHRNSMKAYLPLINKYGRYIGGFYKWKVYNFFGIKKHV